MPAAPAITAQRCNLALCKTCGLLQRCPPLTVMRCARCSARVSQRIPFSIVKTTFFLVLAGVLLFPANILPMMTVLQFGRGSPSTIIGGVGELLQGGFWPIALVVFVASFLVPLGKLISLSALLLSLNPHWPWNDARSRASLFRVLEFLGRWSMLDIFVMMLMAGLVQFGKIAVIEPGRGALAFGVAVIMTMLASLSFDPRLIWDAAEQQAQRPTRQPVLVDQQPQPAGTFLND